MKFAMTVSGLLAALVLHGGDIVATVDTPVNDRYVLPRVCGKYGWQSGIDSRNGVQMMQQLGDDRNQATRMLDIFSGKTPADPVTKWRLFLAESGKIPVLGRNYTYFDPKLRIPPAAERQAAAKMANFLGYRAFNEWGTGADRIIRAAFEGKKVNTPAGRGMFELSKKIMPGKTNPRTREEFEQICRYIWETINAPFDFETHVFDGSHYWAKAWPGGWNKTRAIITENRTPYRNNSIMQALTRGAARMWNVPYGYFPAYDWLARISPPMYSHMQTPRAGYQNQQGLIKISPSLYERLYIYMFMGNAAIIADESDHSRYIDLANSGNFRYSWFGEMCKKMENFNADYDFGISWNPVAIMLSWHNGLVYYGDKAFYRYPYNDGEQMSRELLHRVAYKFTETKQISDEFGATPYGDIFDVLRLDTPKGAVDSNLLANYPVVFLAGEQRFSPEVVKTLTAYVRNGGTLILNTAMLKGGEFPVSFTGAEITAVNRTATAMTRRDGKKLVSGKFRYDVLTPQPGSTVLYSAGSDPVVTRHAYGKGAVILCSPHWLLEEREFIVNDSRRKNILPLAHDLMRQISDELVPFTLHGKNLPEQLMYQVNRKGDGYCIAFYNNGGLTWETPAGGNGLPVEKADPCGTLEFSVTFPGKKMKDAVDFVHHEKLYFRNTKQGQTLDLKLAPGAYTVIEVSPAPIPDPEVIRPVNLALNKPAAADSAVKKHEAAYAVDGNEDFMSAWWSAKACPQSLIVDLGKEETVDSFRAVMAWSFDNTVFPRFQQYRVYAGNDGKSWHQVADESRNMMFDLPQGLHRYFAAPVKARYFKLEVLFNSTRQGAQVIEFQLFAAGKMQKVVKPWKKDPAKAKFPPEMLNMFKKQWLSDLKPVSATQPEAALTADRECYRKGALRIRGREFTKGLGTHAESVIVYHLDPADKWQLFTAYVGVDDIGVPSGTLIFRVYADGRLAADSGRITAHHSAIPIWANISGCRELKLVVTDAGDGIYGDIADWCDAALRK